MRDDHRHSGEAQQPMCNAPQDRPGDSSSPARTDHDQVSPPPFRNPSDRRRDVTRTVLIRDLKLELNPAFACRFSGPTEHRIRLFDRVLRKGAPGFTRKQGAGDGREMHENDHRCLRRSEIQADGRRLISRGRSINRNDDRVAQTRGSRRMFVLILKMLLLTDRWRQIGSLQARSSDRGPESHSRRAAPSFPQARP
jgi:hypothetical protein